MNPLYGCMRLTDRLCPESVVHSVGVDSRVWSSRHWHIAHPRHTTHPHVPDVLVHTPLRHDHRVVLRPLHVVHTRSRSAGLLVWLVLGGKTLGSGLGLLVRLLLWLLLLRGGCTGRGGRGITLGVRVPAFVHRGVLAIPVFERDQYVHVQMGEELGSGAGVWGRELFGEVK